MKILKEIKYDKPYIKLIKVIPDESVKNAPDGPSCGTGSCCYGDDERTGW